jgi:hypothetical protein
MTRATDVKTKGMHYALKNYFDDYLCIERDDISDVSITSTRFKLEHVDIRPKFVNDYMVQLQQPMLLKAGFIEHMMVDHASALWSKEDKDWSIVITGVHLLFVIQEREKPKSDLFSKASQAASKAGSDAVEHTSDYMQYFFGGTKSQTGKVALPEQQSAHKSSSTGSLSEIIECDEDEYEYDEDVEDDKGENKREDEQEKKNSGGFFSHFGWGSKSATPTLDLSDKPPEAPSIMQTQPSNRSHRSRSQASDMEDDKSIDANVKNAVSRLALTIKKMYIRVEDPFTKVAVGVRMDISVKKESNSNLTLHERIEKAAKEELRKLHKKSTSAGHKKRPVNEVNEDDEHLVKEVQVSRPQFYCNCLYEEHEYCDMVNDRSNAGKLKDEAAFVRFMKQSMGRRTLLSEAGLQYLDPILNEVLPERSSMVVVVEQNLQDQEKQTITQMRLQNVLSLSFQQLQLQAMARFALHSLDVHKRMYLNTLEPKHKCPKVKSPKGRRRSSFFTRGRMSTQQMKEEEEKEEEEEEEGDYGYAQWVDLLNDMFDYSHFVQQVQVDITPKLFQEIILPMGIDNGRREEGLFLSGTDGKINLGGSFEFFPTEQEWSPRSDSPTTLAQKHNRSPNEEHVLLGTMLATSAAVATSAYGAGNEMLTGTYDGAAEFAARACSSENAKKAGAAVNASVRTAQRAADNMSTAIGQHTKHMQMTMLPLAGKSAFNMTGAKVRPHGSLVATYL